MMGFRSRSRRWARLLFGYLTGRRSNLARVLRILGRARPSGAAVGVWLIEFIARIRGILALLLMRLRSALFHCPDAPIGILTLLAARLRYGHRDDPGEDGCPVPAYAVI